MTYGQAKKQVLYLMDELKPKADLLEKLPGYFDMGQKEVARYYPLWREAEYGPGQARELPTDCWEPWLVLAQGKVLAVWSDVSGFAGLPERFTLRYKALPGEITAGTGENTALDTPEEAIPAVLYFVAAKCQEMEYDQRYFQNFFAEYQGQLANLATLEKGVALVEPGGAPWLD